jgi:hypothetical protein
MEIQDVAIKILSEGSGIADEMKLNVLTFVGVLLKENSWLFLLNTNNKHLYFARSGLN